MEVDSILRKFSLECNALKLQPTSPIKVGPCDRSTASLILSERVSGSPIHDALIFRHTLLERFDLVTEDHKVLRL